jgi:hypothetical protein
MILKVDEISSDGKGLDARCKKAVEMQSKNAL